jgi:hypothetical protein
VKISQSGPTLWVGRAQAIEGGLLYAIIAFGVLAMTLAYAEQSGRARRWTKRLNKQGHTLGE